jgi:hypothetical protein
MLRVYMPSALGRTIVMPEMRDSSARYPDVDPALGFEDKPVDAAQRVWIARFTLKRCTIQPWERRASGYIKTLPSRTLSTWNGSTFLEQFLWFIRAALICRRSLESLSIGLRNSLASAICLRISSKARLVVRRAI